MSRYGFWILLGACVVAAGTVYALQIRVTVHEIEARADALRNTADHLSERTDDAVSPHTVSTLLERQEKAITDD